MTHETKSQHENTFPLTSLNEQLLAFMRIASAMLKATDLDQILCAITREISRIIEFDRSSVAFLSPDGKSLVLQNIHKGTEESGIKLGEGRSIPFDQNSVIGWVAVNRKPLLRTNIVVGGDFEEVVSEEQLKSDLIVPLTASDEFIGTLNIGSYKADAFSQSDVEVLTNCGQFASLAIQHTRLRLEAQGISERYRTLQQNANDMIMLVDKDSGKFIEVNRKCESVLGYSQLDLAKKTYFDLFDQTDQYQARRDFIKILSEKSMTFVDRTMIDRDGGSIYVDINANLIQLKENSFIQMIVHNVSQRKILEQQIFQKNKDLQEVNTKLTQVDHMKTEFLANISHELRTPLSIIIAYSESLRDPNLTVEERGKFLSVIAENGNSLLSLINNLLELSKLEVTGHKLNITLSHIHDVVKAVWGKVEKRAKSKLIDLTFVPGANVPVTYFDNNQLVQVIACLIQNAIKFTDDGGKVTVISSRRDKEVWVQVCDTGAGIPDEEKTTVFEAFRQVDGSSSRKWGGLGIGLALARHIIELHKGRLWVESTVGVGSTFTLSLPLDTEEEFLMNDLVADAQGVD